MKASALGLACAALCALAACGQDTPLTPDTGSALDWPNSISGMALAAPTLAPGETPVNLQNGAPPWPACAPVVERPAAVLPQFPADLPLPPGLLLFKSLSLHGNANNIQ
ncbi:MAG: hypothetical protein ABI847_06445, partial [Anaerolineales bacterium]